MVMQRDEIASVYGCNYRGAGTQIDGFLMAPFQLTPQTAISCMWIMA